MNDAGPQPPVPDSSDRGHRRSQHLARRRRRILGILGCVVVIAVGAAIGWGAWGHAQQRAAALQTQQQQENFVPTVRTSKVKMVDSPRELDLPGTTQAFESATIYARATGYIAKRQVDIGSRVKAGDVLAIIAAPELDQQLSQARAQLAQLDAALGQARANADLARVTNDRTKKLVGEGWSTKQQGDNDRLTFEAQTAAVRVAEANLQAQKAAVSRLEELTSFERVVAPFDGTITSRQIDLGSLVTADTSTGTSLFTIDRTDVLRVQVYVPQESIFGLKDGEEARVIVPEIATRTFGGRIARNAVSLQAGTRTLLTEVDVDNSQGILHAGLYCTVRFSVPREQPIVTVSSRSIIFDKNGLSVAVYADGKVQVRHIDLARDNGQEDRKSVV